MEAAAHHTPVLLRPHHQLELFEFQYQTHWKKIVPLTSAELRCPTSIGSEVVFVAVVKMRIRLPTNSAARVTTCS